MKSRRSLQTVLFTDIVGSTERARELGDQKWHELLDQHHARVRREIRRFRGREVKSTGDGFLAAFPRPALAIRCAWVVRETLRELDLEVRGGIHMGAVEHHGKDLGGIAVHLGARIASVAQPGQILVSNAVRESEMGTGFQFEDRGRHELKGIEDQWRLFSLKALPTGPYSTDRRMLGLTPRQASLAGAALVVVLAVGAYLLVRYSDRSGGPTEAIAGAAPAIAVLPFRVGGEELEMWREGMVDVLSTNLDGIPGLRAIDSHTMLARWNEVVIGEEIPDSKTALGIAQRIGARYAIQGRVIPAGEKLRIVAELYDTGSGRTLSRAQVEGAVDSLFGLVDQLSIELLRGIVESDEDLAAIDLARATTDSLEALRAYLEGEVHARRGDWIPAVEAYERAVAADSTFAMAWLQLSVANSWGAVLPGASMQRAFEAREQALRYADRLPERNALLVRGMGVSLDFGGKDLRSPSGPSLGLEALLEVTRKYPDDVLGWFLLGDFVFHVGGPLLRPPGEDQHAFERAIQIDPGFAPAYLHYTNNVMRTDPDSARRAELVAIGDSLAAGTPGIGENPIIETLAFGEPEQRDAAIAALDTVSNTIDCHFCIALLVFSHPRYLDIQAELLQVAVHKDNWEPPIAAPRLLRTLLFRGRLSDALESVETPFDIDELLYLPHALGYPIATERLDTALGPEPEEPSFRLNLTPPGSEQITQHAFRGAWAMEQNRPEVFGESLAALRTQADRSLSDGDSLAARFALGGIDALEGFRAWREGRTEEAAKLLDRARLRTVTEFYPLNIVVRWWQAQVALEADELEKAAQYLLSLSHGEVLTTDPWATLHLARVQEELGLNHEARENYEFFALAWRDADPRFQPLVQRARQSANRLRGLGQN